MAGTRKGGLKCAETNRERYGEDYYTEMGRKGGRWKGKKGFALMTPEQRSAAGRKGGQISKRGPAKKEF